MHYFLWNFKSEIFRAGSIHLYWYAVLLIVSYLFSINLWRKLKIKSEKSLHLELYLFLILCISLMFARIGYTFLNPSKVLGGDWITWILPISFSPSFHFTGLQQLSWPAGMIGILAGLILLNKFLIKVNFDELLFKTILPALLAGFVMFNANFIHAFFPGSKTDSPVGTVFIRPIVDGIRKLPCCIMRNPGGLNPLESVSVRKDKSGNGKEIGQRKIILTLLFKKGIEEREASEFIIGDVKTFLFENPDYVLESGTEPIKYAMTKLPTGNLSATINTIAIARHPVQVYYALFFAILFVILFYFFLKNRVTNYRQISGISICIVSFWYFLLEFITEVPTGKLIAGINTNQWIILFLGLIGIFFILTSRKIRVAK